MHIPRALLERFTEALCSAVSLDKVELRQQLVRQHVPLASTPVQREQRVEHLPHLYLARATSAWVLLGRWNHCAHKGPLLVRQIRGISLPQTTFLVHIRTLLDEGICANYPINPCVVPIHISGQPLNKEAEKFPDSL